MKCKATRLTPHFIPHFETPLDDLLQSVLHGFAHAKWLSWIKHAAADVLDDCVAQYALV